MKAPVAGAARKAIARATSSASPVAPTRLLDRARVRKLAYSASEKPAVRCSSVTTTPGLHGTAQQNHAVDSGPVALLSHSTGYPITFAMLCYRMRFILEAYLNRIIFTVSCDSAATLVSQSPVNFP